MVMSPPDGHYGLVGDVPMDFGEALKRSVSDTVPVFGFGCDVSFIVSVSVHHQQHSPSGAYEFDWKQRNIGQFFGLGIFGKVLL